jgi:hypothetical protein
MTQHICAVCRHTFGTSTFPGGSTTYCSRSCGTRWGAALIPQATSKPSVLISAKPVTAPALRLRQVMCGHSVPSYRGRTRARCDSCLRLASVVRPKPQVLSLPCGWCKREFETTRPTAKYCSRSCSSRKYPTTCTVTGCRRTHRAKGLCHRHYKEQYYPDRSMPQFDTDPMKKRRRDAIRSHRRRAAARGLNAENVDRQRVGERDGWRCGVCAKKVDPALVWPHPRSQSLDHVIPLSEGGEHTYANTRIAHLRCNVLRRDRGGNEQLALLG